MFHTIRFKGYPSLRIKNVFVSVIIDFDVIGTTFRDFQNTHAEKTSTFYCWKMKSLIPDCEVSGSGVPTCSHLELMKKMFNRREIQRDRQ